MLFRSRSVDQVAGVLAYELGHVLARHVAEMRASKQFAASVFHFSGYRGPLAEDLVTSRLIEAEADHIGLIVMADAGFDLQECIDLYIEDLRREVERLDGYESLPAFWSTHPAVGLAASLNTLDSS